MLSVAEAAEHPLHERDSRMKFTYLLAIFLLASAFPNATMAQKEAKKPASPPEGVIINKDVAYLPAERKEKADLYLPAKRGKDVRSPAVVIIHGGGWSGGDKGAKREFNIGTTLALHGYVGMSINYALASKGKPTWPGNLHDCKTAVRWLRKNAERLQINPDRIGAIGGSAGGHLTAMLAVTGAKDGLDPAQPYGDLSCRVQCAVDLYGPIDLSQHRDLSMLGKTRDEAPELYRAASPTTYLDRSDPPILILHGTADKTVDVKQSKLFAAALKKAGVEHELVIVEGAPHTFDLQPKQKDLRPKVLAFFDKHLKSTK
jgi:acetyl esterase/lipase